MMKYLLAGAAVLALLLAPVDASARHRDHHWRHHHSWRHGMVVPFGWRHYAYVDWRMRRLHDPGRYHWVFYDGVYLLIDDRGFVIEVYP